MKTINSILQQEMHVLIKNSCAAPLAPNPDYKSFHKSLIKFFFGAAEVVIDYKASKITILTSVNNENRLSHWKNETAVVDFSYSNLEDLLCNCIESGKKQSHFYRSILFHYNHVSQNLGNWSA